MEFLVILIPFLAAGIPVLPGVVSALRRERVAWLLAGVLAALFIWTLTMLPSIQDNGPIAPELEWVPGLNLNLSLYLDGLALIFVLLVTGIGVAIFLYTGYYFEDDESFSRFSSMLMAFTGSMLGVVLSGNVLMLFISWELTSMTSFMLIGFKGKYADARRGALQALIVTASGGLALLAGLMLMGTAAGTFELADILQMDLTGHEWYAAIVVLLVLGAFTKSAQWPFHFWLPGAMAAPSPASAFLHSATMVKAGVYLLLRMYPTLGNADLWEGILLFFGLLTMLSGAVIALRQTDLKGILAYTTISKLGALVALVGLPKEEGIKAALIGIIAHAMYKATFFLLAGVVDHATGTRDIRRLAGLRKQLPGAAWISVVVGLSMAGVIPLLGFVAKETLIEAGLHASADVLVTGVIVLSAVLTVTVAMMLVWDVYFRDRTTLKPEHNQEELHYHTIPNGLLAGPALLATGSIVFGIGVVPMLKPLIELVVTKDFKLLLFPGFNTAFFLSMAALAGGAAVFAVRGIWLAWPWPARPRASAIYDGIIKFAEDVADILLLSQNGKLRHYLTIILGVVGVIMPFAGFDYIRQTDVQFVFSGSEDIFKTALLALSVVGALASVFFRQHLAAALSLGVMGYAIGGIFLLEPAPDVALVQFLVETLATVLVILMLARLGLKQRQAVMDKLWQQRQGGILLSAFIAFALGIGVTLFAVSAVSTRPERETIAQWHLDNAYEEVGVKDVVASILTDFRGTDTLIEITVFAIAGLGVLTLLSLTNVPREDVARVEQQLPIINTPLSRFMATLVLPFALLVSLYHLLYAGDGPGDGFTAGVVSGLAVALWYVVFGYSETKRRLRWLQPVTMIRIGLTLALLNAALPLLLDEAFLRVIKLKNVTPPADLHLASTLLFEIGIFLTVLGSVSVIMEAIAHPTEVEQI